MKRVEMFSESDLGWIQAKMEGLRRATMWCQNVCAIHGLVVKEGKLCVVMDKYQMSLTEAMRLNGGRLTLEQILRFVRLYSLDSTDLLPLIQQTLNSSYALEIIILIQWRITPVFNGEHSLDTMEMIPLIQQSKGSDKTNPVVVQIWSRHSERNE